MIEKVTYYDVCPECESLEIVMRESLVDGEVLTFWCRICGAEWDDYIEDIKREYG